MLNSTSYNFVNLFKLNFVSKKLFFYVKFTSKIFIILKIFKKIGLIRQFYLYKNNQNNNFFKIFLFYFKKFQIFTYCKLLSSPSRFIFISLKSLKLLNKRNGSSIFLIDTSKGLMTHSEAITKGLGGKLFFHVSF